MNERASYTSASAFPTKLIGKANVLMNRFQPIHVQLNITNACQLRCSYCSCRDRDRSLSMDMGVLKGTFKDLVAHGARAVTITGGGEPLLHPQFPEIVDVLRGHELELGLVTNGIAMRSWPREVFEKFSWIRVSFDSEREMLPDLYTGIPIAFSYVYVPGSEKTANFISLTEQAKRGLITHLRVVSDIQAVDNARYAFINKPVHPRIILQDRSKYTRGTSRCWIALIKPVVDVDGLVYPCCGVQYAVRNTPSSFISELCMGGVSKYLSQYVTPQRPFDGSMCDVCYHNMQNTTLEAFKELPEVLHRNFI
jgi:hypothetical protein